MSTTPVRRELLYGLTAGLVLWGFLLFFENAYFAAPAYGISPPTWAAWISGLPLWGLDVIDTLGAFAVVAILVIAFLDTRSKRIRRSKRATGTIGTVLVWVIILLVLAAASYLLFNLTFLGFVNAVRGFFAGL